MFLFWVHILYSIQDIIIQLSMIICIKLRCFTQKSTRFWKDPLTFNVDRWNNTPVPFSYIPFSGGTRSCIGKNLALLEIKVHFFMNIIILVYATAWSWIMGIMPWVDEYSKFHFCNYDSSESSDIIAVI